MNRARMRNIYLGIIGVLVVLIVIISIFFVKSGGKKGDNGITVLPDQAEDGKISITDIYDGNISIPSYNIDLNTYDSAKYVSGENGVVSYGDAALGINVSSQSGDIDWEQVKSSGISFAMIRVGYRGYSNGKTYIDDKFQQNIDGAINAGLDVGVYYYSQAITADEATTEAGLVLEKIGSYKITYPIAFYWGFVDDPKEGSTPRTNDCTPTEITSFADAFCSKISKAGYNTAFYIDKKMGYEYMNLETLSSYDVWYSETQEKPSFYYDFAIWQFSKEGTVNGISNPVGMNLAMKSYS